MSMNIRVQKMYTVLFYFMNITVFDILLAILSNFLKSLCPQAYFGQNRPVPEFIDPVFEKKSPKRSFSMTEINSSTGLNDKKGTYLISYS
jgi:hypothetical protein